MEAGPEVIPLLNGVEIPIGRVSFELKPFEVETFEVETLFS
jgi:hypothetical protein